MKCPYCGNSNNVTVVGIPTVSLLVALAPALGLGVLSLAAATAQAATYRLTGKKIYKCTACNKHFIA